MILRVLLAQINSKVGDLHGNSAKIIQAVRKAQSCSADIVVFPEMSLCGYPPEDLLLKSHFIAENKKRVLQIAGAVKSTLCIVGFPHMEKNRLFNAAAFIYKGRILGIYKKVFLPNYGVFDENRYFNRGDKCHVISFGRDAKAGVNICEDIWYPNGPQCIQTQTGGAGVIINISASPYHAGKIELRQSLLEKRAKENNAFVLYCNLVGGQDELVFDGASLAFDNQGRLLARGRQFEEDFITVDLDLELLKKKATPKNRRQFCLPLSSLEKIALPPLKDKCSTRLANRKEPKLPFVDEVYSALILGLRDYLGKNNFTKAVLGLSGGIDSAVVAALAADAIGRENVVCLIMPSQYSAAETMRDAKKLAGNLGIKTIDISIKEIHRQYLSLLKGYFKGKRPDVTEENVQARIRGNLLMAFSNKFGWLVLTTGNKSETSTGFCTLYGDMAGGFAVLKDVPKGLVYKLARCINRRSGKNLIMPSIINRAPTAELRKGQKDQDTLPAYPVLDKILDLYIENDKSFDEIVKSGFSAKIAGRVIAMVDRSEYKRRQAPPGIKITPKAFGKDRRMPITNLYRG